MILRPLVQPLLRPVPASPLEAAMGFAPPLLFANGEQGFLYINDISTMYQDSAGTIPAVLEQPVGKWLDQSGRGNHATQPTSANRPTVSARYNKVAVPNANPVDLTNVNKSGDAAASLTVVNDAAALAAAGLSNFCTLGNVYKLDNTTGTTDAMLNFGGITGNLNSHVAMTMVRKVGAPSVNIEFFGRGGTSVAGTGYERLTASGVPVGIGAQIVIRVAAGGTAFAILPDLREACYSYLPTPQIILGTGATATDYDSAGFPVRLKFNGTNQWMQTGSIDFSGTDKVTVFAGVTKLSDAAVGTLLEHGIGGTDARAFSFNAPRTAASTDYGADLRDGVATATTLRAAGFGAVHSGVLTLAADYAGSTNTEQLKLRVNGSAAGAVSGGLPAGKFGNYAATMGARGGTSFFFSGDIYCLSARGAATNDTLIAQAERWINGRMGGVF